MTRDRLLLASILALGWLTLPATAQSEAIEALIKKLNSHHTVATTEAVQSYKILFDAYLQASAPPFPISDNFNQGTIHPGMPVWSEVSAWAESNPDLAKAILECRDKRVLGLPYGRVNMPSDYQERDITVDVFTDRRLGIDFPYLDSFDVVEAFAVAESYRLMEAGRFKQGLDLAVANLYLLRQFCDREFLGEKEVSILLMSEALANLRDIFWVYRDDITAEQYTDIGWWDISSLRPGRRHLFMPEADRVVSEAILNEVFENRTGNPDGDKFASVFAEIQAVDQPLTTFGAARRWKMIANVHGSLDASQERLTLIYDDWWRRWRIQEYDPLLDIPSQFERTNPVRYAAVVYSIRDIHDLFTQRNVMITQVLGTAMAAGISAYRNTYRTYPNDVEKVYSQFTRRIADQDIFDKGLASFRYRYLDERTAVDTPVGRVWIEPRNSLLYSVGQDHGDGRGMEHTDDGISGDLIIWPPIKALAREQGLID